MVIKLNCSNMQVVKRINTGYGLPADIWSLGCTVLEMLTGQIPYSPLECVCIVLLLLCLCSLFCLKFSSVFTIFCSDFNSNLSLNERTVFYENVKYWMVKIKIYSNVTFFFFFFIKVMIFLSNHYFFIGFLSNHITFETFNLDHPCMVAWFKLVSLSLISTLLLEKPALIVDTPLSLP